MLVEQYVKQALAENCLPSVLLFPANKKAVALELAAKLLRCPQARLESNPDFHVLSPEGKSALHSIESIRAVITQSHTSSFVGNGIVVLIESAERMQPAAANALLKTLEEPAGQSTWILLAEKPQELLPTVLSRCAKVGLEEAKGETVLGEEGQILQKLLQDPPSYPKLALELDKIEKLIEGEGAPQKGRALLTLVAEYLHQMALKNDGACAGWEESLEKSVVAFDRNIKLFTCLECLFIKHLLI